VRSDASNNNPRARRRNCLAANGPRNLSPAVAIENLVPSTNLGRAVRRTTARGAP